MRNVVVIGAGVGGLSAAALLARRGLDVTVLEAHVYPGGCAGTFYHQGYRFEAGATLAGGFYPGGPMDVLAQTVGIDAWPAHTADPAMQVHLPGGQVVTRWTTPQARQAYREAFGPEVDSFWDWQERTADSLWDLALRLPAWPPQDISQGFDLAARGLGWLASDLRARLNPALAADAFRPVSAHLSGLPEQFRLFVDAQLLIAAQTTSRYTNALYGASALDLPRRGVVHLQGGIGAIAATLADALRRQGGKLLLRHEVSAVYALSGGGYRVETRRGESFAADLVIANLPPWNIRQLLGESSPASLRRLPNMPQVGWGAFMAYIGLEDSIIPDAFPLHHQVIMREPLGEGNTVFLSLSPDWDAGRAPHGQRALTISTHTELGEWWRLYANDRPAYEQRKEAYTQRLLQAAETALPGLSRAARLVMPGTPVTFQRFTRRQWGWVGGFPQTSLFTAWGPRLLRNFWMVGDSIFPGQSTAAVALGGLRIAAAILRTPGFGKVNSHWSRARQDSAPPLTGKTS
jgi:C-3',4' desaturase CrtD